MIWLYSGKVGAGKSYHLMKDIVEKLKSGGYVVSNFPINFDTPAGRKLPQDHFIFLDDDCWTTPKQVMKEAIRIELWGNKQPILLAIDEAADIFNTREWQEKTNEHDRKAWNTFFRQHRKQEYNIILVSQDKDYLDKQIRKLIDYEEKHRLINKYKFLKLLPMQVFVVLKYWCEGTRPPMTGRDWIVWRPWVNKLYNTLRLFGQVGRMMDELRKEVIQEEQEKMDPLYQCRNTMWAATWEGYE